MKLLRLLQNETEETNRAKVVSEHEAEFDIAAGVSTGTYTLRTHSSQAPIEMSAEGLLTIAAWVGQHRDQLRKEAGQELLSYHVKLYASRVVPLDSHVPEFPIEALNAQEAAIRALRHYGTQQMKVIVVISTTKEETFSDVELQADQSITFTQHEEKRRSPLDTQK